MEVGIVGRLPAAESPPSRPGRVTVGLAEALSALGHDVAVAATEGDPGATGVPATTGLARGDVADADLLAGRHRHGVVPAPGLDTLTLLGLADPGELWASGDDTEPTPATGFARTTAALAARDADTVVATTPLTASLAGDEGVEVDAVVPVGAADRFHAADAYDGTLDTLFVGRISPDRLPHWLEAETPADYSLALVGPGQGPYTRGLDCYRGVVDEDTLREAYRRAGAFVCPTAGDGLPLTVTEALAAGTPLVAPADTPVGDVVERRGVGVTFPRGDPEGYRTALRDLFWRRRPDRAAEVAADRFTWERVARSYLDIYGW